MSFACGIVGLPNVGKSTLFNALSSGKALAGNFPFCTVEPNVGVVAVPDERLDQLATLYHARSKVNTSIRFLDIAGLVKGASKGEGLGNQFLANIREVDVVVQVVRCFEDPDVTHVHGHVDPVADVETIHTELCLKDLESVTKRLERARKQSKGGDAVERAAVSVCERLSAHLGAGDPAKTFAEEGDTEAAVIRDLQLLTRKPSFYVANVDEASLGTGLADNRHYQALAMLAKRQAAPLEAICASLEAQIAELEPEDRGEFLESAGLTEPGLFRVIKTGYELLGLITFFTAGEKECRAWTVPLGSLAPKAAGVIHTDFERGFIRAEVIDWRDLMQLGSEAKCRESGKARVEGKDYVVHDGDVMHFRFNV